MQQPDGNNIKTITETISKNPVSFVGAAFFVLFWGYFIWSQNKTDNESLYWKKQYETERNKSDELYKQLLIRNGIIQDFTKSKQMQDSILYEKTIKSTTELLEDYEQ